MSTDTDTPSAIRAEFSPCGKFRHSLVWVWDESLPILPWLLHNPSVAGQARGDGSVKDDPTARKGRGFSERHGFGGLVFVNPFDYISTEPAGLKAAGYPVSADNDRHILAACAMGDGRVVAAGGALWRGLSRPLEALKMIRAAGYRTVCFGRTDDGLPRHPLMLAYSTPMEDY